MGMSSALDGAWVAIHVRVNREWTVANELARHGYEQLLPTYVPRQQASGRRAPQPLFPGYLFCRYTLNNPHRIVQTPGVLQIVGIGRTPIAVPDDEVEAIRRVVMLGIHSEPWRFLEVGQRVLIRYGPLAGVAGILLAVRNSIRLIVSITLLRRAVALEIDARDVVAQTGVRGLPEPLPADAGADVQLTY